MTLKLVLICLKLYFSQLQEQTDLKAEQLRSMQALNVFMSTGFKSKGIGKLISGKWSF